MTSRRSYSKRVGVNALHLLLLAFVSLFFVAPASAALRVVNLKCEHAVDPLGVDAATPRLSWQLSDDDSAARGSRQTEWQVLVASTPELLAADRGDLWDSARVASSQTAWIGYAGKPLVSSQQVFWKARAWDAAGAPTPWSATATWTMGVLRAEDWHARWIEAAPNAEGALMRHEFMVKPSLKRAVLHVSGLGQYEAFLNGAKVGVDLLTPGWTDYRDTVLYDTHDVTAQLAPGANAIGLALGRGMYHVERKDGRFAKFTSDFGELRAIAQLRLEYADGSVEFVGTDETWRTHPGPITWSSLYGGEDHDARRLPANWSRVGAAGDGWMPVKLPTAPIGALRCASFANEPLRAIETREPASVRTLADGAVLFDFGQNASFMPRLTVSGPAGSTVRLVPGEVVKEDGSIERGTMGGAHRGSAWWQYTKATDGEETWFPQFYYVGSRYVRAELKPAAPGGATPKIERLQMVIVHAAAEPVGEFATSNPLLNRIRDLVRWAQRSNLVSILTDCPHREKLGWIEQFHLNGPAIRHEFDVTRTYAKGMRDMAEAQLPDGLVPNIAPEFVEFKGAFRGAAEWGAAFLLVPWQQRDFTGDESLLREFYPAMQRYFAYLETRADHDILSDGLGDWYDYAINSGKRANLTPPPITATAFFYDDARTLARTAALLGKPDDAARYAARAEEIRRAYVAKFRRADGLYGTASQASLCIPLVMGLVEERDRAGVLAALIRDVEEKGYASAGDIGFRYLLLALAEAGRDDVIYRLVNQDEKPGYGYQLKLGATALTESWHASLGASHNHFMLGQITEWFYERLAGIAPDPQRPGFQHAIIRPQPVGDLAWVEATQRTLPGEYRMRWERGAEKLALRVTVPANASATVYLPTRDAAAIRESGQTLGQTVGAKFVRIEGDRAVIEVESGVYSFETPW
ncbi:MAG: family 78 glycoside hydrolase catalytic domain [Opitutae bacterium]|nr:family 78 glycoside hydrolase catalytic domain [Opitutae bacterium]